MRIDNIELKCHKDDEGIYHFSFEVPEELIEFSDGSTKTDCTNHLVSLDLHSQSILIEKNLEKEFEGRNFYRLLYNPKAKKKDQFYIYYFVTRVTWQSIWFIGPNYRYCTENLKRKRNIDGVQCIYIDDNHILSSKDKITTRKFIKETMENQWYEKMYETIWGSNYRQILGMD